MIRLMRERTAAAIPSVLRGTRRVKQAEELIALWNAQSLVFREHIWKAAKDQLKKESSGKCAYCEVPTSVVAYGDVEHFRPKSVYWWLAYCHENFVYACQICNQLYKKDHFEIAGKVMGPEDLSRPSHLTPDPLGESEGMPYALFRTACLAELAHLPDVYEDDVAALFRYVPDPVKKTVSIEARSGSAECLRAASAVDRLLGLNRQELLRLRWSVYEVALLCRDTIETVPGTRPAHGAKELALQLMADGSMFAGMARYFFQVEWRLDL